MKAEVNAYSITSEQNQPELRPNVHLHGETRDLFFFSALITRTMPSDLQNDYVDLVHGTATARVYFYGSGTRSSCHDYVFGLKCLH